MLIWSTCQFSKELWCELRVESEDWSLIREATRQIEIGKSLKLLLTPKEALLGHFWRPRGYLASSYGMQGRLLFAHAVRSFTLKMCPLAFVSSRPRPMTTRAWLPRNFTFSTCSLCRYLRSHLPNTRFGILARRLVPDSLRNAGRRGS